MKTVTNIKCYDPTSTGSTGIPNYYNTITSAVPNNDVKIVIVDSPSKIAKLEDVGIYSIYEIANWFLNKGNMTHDKLQILCFYVQAWNYSLNEKRLIRADFQAWTKGPVSPALYERFKCFGNHVIEIDGSYKCNISEEDINLLDNVWKYYGDKSGDELGALVRKELPWLEARRGYAKNEDCTVVISPDAMKTYYKSIASRKIRENA